MQIIRRLKASALLRNVFAVASGTAAGQAVAFAFSPLITRIYSPEVFGLQGVFLSLVSILTPVVALRYPMAIIVADDESEARLLGQLSMRISFVLSCLLGLILLIAQGRALTLLGAEALGSLIWFLPLALFCVAAQDVASFRASRHGEFRRVGIVNVIQAFLTNLVRVLGGLAAPVAGVLVAITSIAPAVQAALLKFGGSRKRSRASSLRMHEAISLLRKHGDFPLYRVPTDVLNSASQSVPVIMLAGLFSPAAAGLYVLTRSVLNLPANLINVAIGNVLYARFAELARAEEPLMPLLLRSTLALLIPTPLIVGVAWFAPSGFALIFGEEWREAGHYARWMAVWIAMMIVNVPSMRVLAVINRQGLALIFNVALLAVRIMSILSAYWIYDSSLTAVAAFSIGSVAMIILSIVLFHWCTVVFDRRLKEAHNG